MAGLNIRGAAFTSGGRLLALDAADDALLEFDPQAGLPVGTATARQFDGEPFDVSNLVDLAESGRGDLAGRKVRQLASSTFAAGRHEVAWDGCDDHGRALPAGVYACRVGSAGEKAWVRLTLVK